MGEKEDAMDLWRNNSQDKAQDSDMKDVESLTNALEEERAKAEKNLIGWQRAQADYINYKKRIEREQIESTKYSNIILISELLPVIDDLDRALNSIPENLDNTPWVDGIRLIYRKFWGVLEAVGVSSVEAIGEEFDPVYHEAICQVEGKEGIVIEATQKGYRLHDRVIRPSQVAVGCGVPDTKE